MTNANGTEIEAIKKLKWPFDFGHLIYIKVMWNT